MTSPQNNRLVENRLHDAVKVDRARIQLGRISRFGLLELSRQRLRSSISEANYSVCPHCEGTGHIRNVTSSALSFLRIIEEEALKENTEAVYVELPLETATFLLNEKRHEINQIQARLGTRIAVVPSISLHGSQFNIRRLRSEDLDDSGNIPSYEIKLEEISLEGSTDHPQNRKGKTAVEAAVKLDQVKTGPPPKKISTAKKKDGTSSFPRFLKIWKTFIRGFSPVDEPPTSVDPAPKKTTQKSI